MASMKKSMAFLSLVLMMCVMLCRGSYGYRGGLVVGGKKEIEEVKSNREVQELGRFSVDEYNRRLRLRPSTAEVVVEFRQVVEAQSQVVSGIKYYLKILASQNGKDRVFDSQVVVKPWLRSKHLLHFSPSPSSTTRI